MKFMTRAYKLFRVMKNGQLRSLFIDNKVDLPVGVWLGAKAINTPGFAYRPGWHACSKKSAPHLSKKGRVWCLVTLENVYEHQRPKAQGGLWYTAGMMRIEKVLDKKSKA